MTPDPLDDWKLPALDELGEQFRRLEKAERAKAKAKRNRLLLAPAVAFVITVAVLALVQRGEVAHAGSIINRAPAAAIKSSSVRFQSTISVTAGGHEIRSFAQNGEIDFAKGSYRTILHLNGGAASSGVEYRSVGGVLYLGLPLATGPPPSRPRWVAVRLSGPQRAILASAPESDGLTDPLALLRILAHTHAPVSFVGTTSIGGVSARHYHVETDFAELLQASSGSAMKATAGRPVTASLDVWLDDKGRPRRIVELLSGTSSRSVIALQATTTFTDYGSRTHIHPPPGVRPSPTLGGDLSRPLIGGPGRVFLRLLSAPLSAGSAAP